MVLNLQSKHKLKKYVPLLTRHKLYRMMTWGKIIKSIFAWLTPTLSAWPLRGHTALKSILWETLFLDQFHDFSLLSLNTLLHPFLRSKFMKKNSLTPKKFHFQSRIWELFFKGLIYKCFFNYLPVFIIILALLLGSIFHENLPSYI